MSALLKSRAGKGATQEELRRIVAWAEETRREAAAIESESKPRRAPRGTGKAARRARPLRRAGARSRRSSFESGGFRTRRIGHSSRA